MAKTIEGGVYVTAQKQVVDANGKPLPEYQFNQKTGKVTKVTKPAAKTED